MTCICVSPNRLWAPLRLGWSNTTLYSHHEAKPKRIRAWAVFVSWLCVWLTNQIHKTNEWMNEWVIQEQDLTQRRHVAFHSGLSQEGFKSPVDPAQNCGPFPAPDALTLACFIVLLGSNLWKIQESHLRLFWLKSYALQFDRWDMVE